MTDTLDVLSGKQLILRDFLAADRTSLANERTFLGYIRTFLNFLIVGISLIKLFSSPYVMVIGVVLIIAGVSTLSIGLVKFILLRKRMQQLQLGNIAIRD